MKGIMAVQAQALVAGHVLFSELQAHLDACIEAAARAGQTELNVSNALHKFENREPYSVEPQSILRTIHWEYRKRGFEFQRVVASDDANEYYLRW